jgi:hypothetical protein
MRLSLARGDIDEIVLSEPRRALEHGAGDLDRIVAREQSYHPEGSIIEWRETVREFAPCLDIRIHQQPAEDLIKQVDMIGVKISAREKEGADASDHCGPGLARTVVDSRFQFADEPSRCRHIRVPDRPYAHAREGAQPTAN